MQPPHQSSRINLDELKAQIVKKLGHEGSKQYFHYLQRFLSLKLSRVEFNKLCLRILGRENIPLHNHLIRSILKNACCANSPPHKSDASKHATNVSSHEIPCDVLTNGGDILPISPKKARSGSRGRRIGHQNRALGPNGKTNQHIVENGSLNERDNLVSHIGKTPEIRSSQNDPPLVHSKEKMELVVRNDRSKPSSSSPLQPPFGVPFCPVSTGGAYKALSIASSSRSMATFDDCSLLDSHELRDRMEHIASSQGIEGVSMECANILNLGLDSYIKGLLKSCIGARSKHDAQNGRNSSISLEEFRVSMEVNPQQLGEDWPLLLEKICTRAFEE